MGGKVLAPTLACFFLWYPVLRLYNRITWTSKEELLAMLDDPALILLDARYGKD
jgi:hypothetical protein